MSHLDDESLAGLAIGDGDPADAAHTDACDQCRAELEVLCATLRRVQSGADGGPLLTPPDRVWDRIVAELETDDAEPGETTPDSTDAARPAPGEPVGAADELAERRRRRAPVWAVGVAAAAGVVIGGVAVGAVVSGGGDSADVVAQTELTDLATETTVGDAILETRDDGTQVLVIDTDFVDLDGAYLEVWLIDESIEGMISLGHLTGDTTEFVVPAGFDVSGFPIVDISVEPLDGVPTHSGDSVTRGVLDV